MMERQLKVLRMRLLWVGLAMLTVFWGCAKREPLPGDPIQTDAAPFAKPREGKEAIGNIESKLFPSDLIMENQLAIGLSPGQREAIQKEIERAQVEMSRLQWDLNVEKEKLAQVLALEKVDEGKVTEAAQRVMVLENKVKSTHLLLLVRIKNQLNATQQGELQRIRAKQ